MPKDIGLEISDYQKHIAKCLNGSTQAVTISLKFKSGMSYHCMSKRVKGIGLWKNFDRYITSNLENAGNVLTEVCIVMSIIKVRTFENIIYTEYWKPNPHKLSLTGEIEWMLSERKINDQVLYDELSQASDVGIYL